MNNLHRARELLEEADRVGQSMADYLTASRMLDPSTEIPTGELVERLKAVVADLVPLVNLQLNAVKRLLEHVAAGE